jgi:hypothetical protein
MTRQQQPKFDRHQFEKLDPRADIALAKRPPWHAGQAEDFGFSINRPCGLEGDDVVSGMHVDDGKKMRDHAHGLKDTKKILEVIRQKFPKVWIADRPLRVRVGLHRAGLWFDVGERYFIQHEYTRTIAEELGVTEATVKGIVQRFRKAWGVQTASGYQASCRFRATRIAKKIQQDQQIQKAAREKPVREPFVVRPLEGKGTAPSEANHAD